VYKSATGGHGHVHRVLSLQTQDRNQSTTCTTVAISSNPLRICTATLANRPPVARRRKANNGVQSVYSLIMQFLPARSKSNPFGGRPFWDRENHGSEHGFPGCHSCTRFAKRRLRGRHTGCGPGGKAVGAGWWGRGPRPVGFLPRKHPPGMPLSPGPAFPIPSYPYKMRSVCGPSILISRRRASSSERSPLP
jgi:hypothetical protein